MLVGCAARRYLEERSCFENINRHGDRRLNKGFLTFLDLAGCFGTPTSAFFSNDFVLLYQVCRLLESIGSVIYVVDRLRGNQKFGPLSLHA